MSNGRQVLLGDIGLGGSATAVPDTLTVGGVAALPVLLGASVLGDVGVVVGARPVSWSTAGWTRKMRAVAVLQQCRGRRGRWCGRDDIGR